jgi:nicotinamide riboside kinase
MLFGYVPNALLSYPRADLYLRFAADVPWVADGTRFFGEDAERRRFADIAEGILNKALVRWIPVDGSWDDRAETVRKILRNAPALPTPWEPAEGS